MPHDTPTARFELDLRGLFAQSPRPSVDYVLTNIRERYAVLRTDVIQDLSDRIGTVLGELSQKGVRVSPVELLTAVHSLLLEDGVRAVPRRIIVARVPQSSGIPAVN